MPDRYPLPGLSGTLLVESFESSVLRDNPLDDPAVRNPLVYLPPGYDDSDERYPVVFCLAGFTGTSWSFANYDAFVPTLPQRFERLLADGRSGPAILVMVDGMTSLGGNQYINSAAVGRWADHILDELVPHVDSTYRTMGDGHRGIMGKSSGGYGAIIHAMKHSDVWSAAACHSGDMYFDYCYLPDFPGAIDALRKHPDVRAWFDEVRKKPKKQSEDFKPINIVAMAAFYSANPDAVMGIDLPFELPGGRIREDVWARWLEHDPVRLVDSRSSALKSLKLLFIDCGNKDEFNLHHGARMLTQRLEALEVPHQYEEFEDTHMAIQYRYDVSIPLLVEALA
jgi:enterochelin esterase family protein